MRTSPASPAQARTRSQRLEARRRVEERHARMHRLALLARVGALGVLLGLVVLLAGMQYAERDEIRSGVRAWGVDLGGMTRAEARTALEQAAAERIDQPLVLIDGERRWELSAGDLGLVLDVDRVVEDAFATGRDGAGPDRLALLWHLRRDPHDLGLDSIAVQGELLDTAVQQLQGEIARERIDPSLTNDPDNGPVFVAGQTGRALDIERAREEILLALSTGSANVRLEVAEDPPAVPDSAFTAAREQLERIWDAPIELAADQEVWTLTPQQISTHLTVVPPEAGRPASLELDEVWIDGVVWEISLATDRLPRGARVWWDVSGALIKTADGEPGRDLDEDAARPMIRAAFLGENDANRVELPVAIANQPALPADLGTLGIASKLAESSTEYGGGLPERMHNIELAARLLNGVVILPGQLFSFNAEIGPMTLEAGFQMGYGIAEGDDGVVRTIPAEAGGICQVATTVFQPVFWSGYEINQRGTHSYWIPNYAYNGYVGLDAAVEPTIGLDLQWTNNSSTAVLIEAVADGQRFTVRLYGTPPPWTVQIDAPVITNEVAADETVHYEPSPSLPDGETRRIERAHKGFDVTVVRRITENGVERQAEFKAAYVPSRNVVLVGSQTGELPEGFVPPE